MGNPIEGDMVSPAAPNPNPDRGSYNALTGSGQMPQQPQPQMPQAPSHQETVAALRHFMAIIDELQTLEKNESLGRADCKGEIIDGVTGLVSKRMLSAADAVAQLASVPDQPLAQRKWVMQMMRQTIAAQNNVLAHHAMGNQGTLDWSIEKQHQPGSKDDHMNTMSGLGSKYRR